MSVPFSNTNLRIPKGFGNLLEGLAREVLRDQPEDIPAFAELYFAKLLKERKGDFLFVLASSTLFRLFHGFLPHE